MTKEQAKAILGDMAQEDGKLRISTDYIAWDGEVANIALETDNYTADTLEALAWWMRNVKVTV